MSLEIIVAGTFPYISYTGWYNMKNKNLARIHILKNKLGLSDETYKTLLQESYQVSSSKGLNIYRQNSLIYHKHYHY